MKITSLYPGIQEPSFSYENEVCSGDTVYFNNDLQNVVTLLWDFGDGTLSSDITPHHRYDSSGVYNISLSVTDSGGCIRYYSLPVPVTVYAPEAGFAITGTTEACDSLTVVFNNVSADAQSYIWDFGDGQTSNLINPVHSYQDTGIFSVTLTAINHICQDILTLDSIVEVRSADAGFTFTQSNYCLPVSVVYTDNSSAAVSWNWNFGDGDTSNVQHPTHVFDTIPPGEVILTITDTNGCQATAGMPNISALSAGFSVSVEEGCLPLTVSFSDLSVNAVSWQWDFGDSTTSSSQSPVHTYTDTGSYNILLIVESVDGCSDTLFADSLITVKKPVS